MAKQQVKAERRQTPYEIWLQQEGIPIIGGNQIPDIMTVPLEPWPRKGGLGAQVNFELFRQVVDAYLCEIPKGEELKPQRHLFEEVILVLKGSGASTVWVGNKPKHTFEWEEGSLFAIPLNAWHQHFSTGNEAVRYLAVTTAPSIINAFHNDDFIFNNDYVFQDRYQGQGDYFSGEARTWMGMEGVATVWESNFIKSIFEVPVFDFRVRGAAGDMVSFQLDENCLVGHMSVFPARTYKKGHRHPQVPGFIGLTLTGRGYSLVWDGSYKWSEAVNREKIEWSPNCLWTYSGERFHQHFNVSDQPGRYLAFYLGSRKYPGFGLWFDRWSHFMSVTEGGNQIDYQDEDPEIYRIFERELKKAGLKPKNPATWRK